MFNELESESFIVLPERLETADTNTSSFTAYQANFAAELARGSAMQAIGQSNWAGAIVTQVNL